MKISYRGMKKSFPAAQQEKLDVKLGKLSKMLDGPAGEKEAHVVVTTERRLSNAEITLHYRGHQMVGIGSDTDLFQALTKAVDKTEKQVTKLRAKWRTTTRKGKKPAAAAEAVESYGMDGVARIYRVDQHEKAKPLTID
jgi:putative sigma-54 modulation protein